MNGGSGFRARRATLVVTAALALAVAGCVSTAPVDPSTPEPVVCTDPSLVELRAQHPDSLSEREWQRYQVLEHDCSVARAEVSRETRHGPRDNHRWWMWSGLAMTVMMIAMWVP